MRAFLAATLVGSASAAWPSSSSGRPVSPPVITEDRCYNDGVAVAGDKDKAVACGGSGSYNPMISNSVAQANCLVWETGTTEADRLLFEYGPIVAGMPGCCQAATDLGIMAQAAASGVVWATLGDNACWSKACVAGGSTGEMAHLVGSFNSAYRGFMHGNVAPLVNATNWVGKLPSASAWAESENILWQDSAACMSAITAWQGKSGGALGRYGSGAAAIVNIAGPGIAGVSYQAARAAAMVNVSAACTQNPTHPMHQIAHCTDSSANPVVSGSLAPRCYTAASMGQYGGLYRSNCSDPSVTQTFNAPSCLWRSTTPAIMGAVSMSYGPRAASIPGCCTALQDLTVVAWTNAPYPHTQSQCTSANGCLVNQNAQPLAYWGGSNTTPAANLVGTYPSFAAWWSAWNIATKDGAACAEAAKAHYSVATGEATNALLGGALNAYVAGLKGADAAANTTRGCNVGGLNWGALKPACCVKAQTLLTLNAVNAYDVKSTGLCSDAPCAVALLAALQGIAAADWTPRAEHAKTLLGASSASSGGGSPDICASSLANYLTTTTTTTAAPTTAAATTAAATTTAAGTTSTTATTTAGSSSTSTTATTTAGSSSTTATTTTTAAAVVTVASAYTATEVLPANVTVADLLSNANYVTAKQTGLATTLSVSASAVTITGFEFPSRRARQLSTASKTVKTSFTVQVADASAATTVSNVLTGGSVAATIQTNTNMSGVSVGGVTPTITVSAVTAPTTVNVPTLTSGTFKWEYFTDSTCSTAATNSGATATVSGTIGGTSSANCVAGNTASTSMHIATCSTGVTGASYSSADCSGSAGSASSDKSGVCTYQSAGSYSKLTCTAPAAGSSASTTSNAAAVGVSAVAVVAGVLML